MKLEKMKYIFVGFLLGIFLMFFLGAFLTKEAPGRYRLHIDGGMIHVLDTQTGIFETYMPQINYDKFTKEEYRYKSIGKAIPYEELEE